MLTETTPGAWIDFEHLEVRFLKSSGQFLWPSWRDGNMHLYLYSFDKQNPMAADAKLERQLTNGDFEVLGIEGVDEAAGTVFFSANKDDPRQVHIFSVQLDGSGFKALTTEEGMHIGNFSDDGKHYPHTSFGPQRSPSVCAVHRGRSVQSGMAGARRHRRVRAACAEVSGVQSGRRDCAVRPIVASSRCAG